MGNIHFVAAVKAEPAHSHLPVWPEAVIPLGHSQELLHPGQLQHLLVLPQQGEAGGRQEAPGDKVQQGQGVLLLLAQGVGIQPGEQGEEEQVLASLEGTE